MDESVTDWLTDCYNNGFKLIIFYTPPTHVDTFVDLWNAVGFKFSSQGVYTDS